MLFRSGFVFLIFSVYEYFIVHTVYPKFDFVQKRSLWHISVIFIYAYKLYIRSSPHLREFYLDTVCDDGTEKRYPAVTDGSASAEFNSLAFDVSVDIKLLYPLRKGYVLYQFDSVDLARFVKRELYHITVALFFGRIIFYRIVSLRVVSI